MTLVQPAHLIDLTSFVHILFVPTNEEPRRFGLSGGPITAICGDGWLGRAGRFVEGLMPDSRLSLLLHMLARVAFSVELAPTLQILLDSLSELVRFDAGGIFVREADTHAVRARAVCGFPPDLHRPETEGIVGMVMRTGTPRLVHDVQEDVAYVSPLANTIAADS